MADAAAGSGSGRCGHVQQAGAGQGAQQGVTQHVGGESGPAGGCGFLLLAALVVLQLPGALAFGFGGELVLDEGVGVRVVDAAGGERLPQHSEALITWAAITLMTRHRTRPSAAG
jgi:hypothetical protein